MKQKWRLKREDVGVGGIGSAISRRRKLTKQSRALDIRSFEYTLTHLPTGIKAEGQVERGHYTRKQMRQALRRLYIKLWYELEDKVARHLRIPGR